MGAYADKNPTASMHGKKLQKDKKMNCKDKCIPTKCRRK